MGRTDARQRRPSRYSFHESSTLVCGQIDKTRKKTKDTSAGDPDTETDDPFDGGLEEVTPPEWVLIPAGDDMMGCSPKDQLCYIHKEIPRDALKYPEWLYPESVKVRSIIPGMGPLSGIEAISGIS